MAKQKFNASAGSTPFQASTSMSACRGDEEWYGATFWRMHDEEQLLCLAAPARGTLPVSDPGVLGLFFVGVAERLHKSARLRPKE
jgi:hypothetical protein